MSEGGHHEQLIFLICNWLAISSQADGSRKPALSIFIPVSERNRNQAALCG